MTVVYPLMSQLDYTELRYSLRSIDKYLKRPFEVIVVGSTMPEWINNVTQINLPDVPGQNQLSVRRKILAAFACVDEFFFMNDDIYLLKPADHNFPYYSSGLLIKVAESGSRQLLSQLQALNKPTRYYGHYPSIYKKDFSQALENFTSDCITKSAYCNFIEVTSTEIPDCKIMTARKPVEIKEFIKSKPCFSTGVHSLKSALPVLQELYPSPSKFEL